MNTEVKNNVAIVHGAECLISDVQSTLDLIATVKYETGCTVMVLRKESLCDDFWKLSTRLAGEVLQKFINYQMRLAVVGDFSALAEGSKSLHDFIYESNQGSHILFVDSETDALNRLGA